MSDVKIPGAGQEIIYMELQKGKGNPAPCKTNFSIFEPELKKPVCMDNDTQISLAKQQYQNSPQKEIKLSDVYKRQDKNFAKKKIRFVLELAFE